MIFSPEASIENIKKISPAYQKRFLKLGIKTVRDLIYHFPRRYDDFSNIVQISDLRLDEVATIQGKITQIKNIRTWRKRINITEAFIQDQSGLIRCVWFNQPFLIEALPEGSSASVSGKVSLDNKSLYLSNPAYEKLADNDGWQRTETDKAISHKPLATRQLRHTGRLIPVYPETAGLSSRYLRYLIQIVSPSVSQFEDWLPPEVVKQQNLLKLTTSLRQIHFPDSADLIQKARRRLAFDELFLIQIFTFQQKLKWQKETSFKISFQQKLIKAFVDGLPFKLTPSQRQSAWEIFQDLEKLKPMNRLLEGDVGSGKTVVAALAALQTASAGYQVALMAPTEILAQQHFQSLSKLLKDYEINVGLLTASESKTSSKTQLLNFKKSEIFNLIKNGEIHFLIGTHALIQKKIKFKKLALVILDEQHRFGVQQRAALQRDVLQIEDGSKTTIPHLLSMTATPIPRTLALTIYGDLDISILKDMPVGRQKIITQIVHPQDRQKTYDFIKEQIKQSRQIFVICPRIEIDQTIENIDKNRLFSLAEIKAVKEEYEKLSKIIFPNFKISMLHGRLKAKEKEKIMFDFTEKKTDILVSTSVVEVGIDVPNATVMMIEGADRFGLAQLHQFRGRVGRGPHQSYCFLFTESPAARTGQRLKAMITAKNGFELAEKDLEIRGPGEFFGTRQSGLPDLSMASLADIDLIKQVRAEASRIINQDPELNNHPLLKKELQKFEKNVHLE